MSSTDWKQPFLQLQQSIEPLIAVKHRLFHSNLCLPFHDRERATEFASYLEASHMAEELAGIIETPTVGCRFHGHFYFGSSAVFQQMGSLLKDLHSWIDDMPRGLLPMISLPRTGSQTRHNLALWSDILLQLAWSQNKWHFAAEVEFQPELDRIGFRLWEDLNQPPHLDPIGVLTHQEEISIPFSQWPKLFAEMGLNVPECFGAYLRDAGSEICGDFLKASISAIDIITYMLPERVTQTVGVESKHVPLKKRTDHSLTKASRSDRAKPREGELFSEDARVLLDWLIVHHGCSSGIPNVTPFENQSTVVRGLAFRGTNFTQSRVSISLKELMSEAPRFRRILARSKDGKDRGVDGAKTYAALCSSENICEVLNNLQLKSNQYLEDSLKELKEIAVENMERYSKRGF